jgi:hypothetical protein
MYFHSVTQSAVFIILETVNIRIIDHLLTNYIRAKLNVFWGINLILGEICALLGYYAAYSGKWSPAFRDNLLVPYSRFVKSKMKQI